MQGVEIKFAQKLAGNDKEARDKALKKLKKWIQLRSKPDPTESVYSEVELLKLWKGLFFCMWMSDKPLVQEMLAEELSCVVHVFPRRDDAITFIDTFFITMAREWNSIDNIRKDKFMMLVRRVLRQSLQLAADAGWEDAILERLLAVYQRAFARPEEPATLPLGLQLHCVDIFLEEVAKVSRGGITAPQLAMLLQPFVELLKVSKDSRLVSAVTDGVFFHLMRQSDLGIAHDAVVNGEVPPESDDDEEESAETGAPDGEGPLDPRAGGVDVSLPQLPLDCTQLSERLMEAGSDPSVRQKNRETLYRLAAQFRDLEEGTYPLAVKLPSVVESDSDLSDEDIQAAVQRLKKSQATQKEEREGRRKRRHRGVADDDDAAETTPDPEPAEPAPKKRKKVRNKVAISNGVIDTGERLLSEAERAAEAVEEDAEAASPDPSRPLTPKEKRKQRLGAVKDAREKKLEQKKRCQESKQAVANGTEGAHEGNDVKGSLENGDVPDTLWIHIKKKGKKTSASLSPADSSSAAQQNGQQVQTNKIGSLKKQKKNKLNQNNESMNGNHVPASASPKKKKKARSGASETSGDSSSPLNDKASELAAKEPQANGTCELQLRSKDQKKPKKVKKTAGAAGDMASEAPSGGAVTRAQTSPVAGAADWAVPAADDWGELAPGDYEFFVPSKKAMQKAAAAPGKASPLAKFVPSKPTAVFAKTRGSPKAGKVPSQKSPSSPITPKRKKLKICLNKNMEQTFKEHLITVRNSPGVPHNPQMMPSKGLLKTPVKTPVSQVKTYQKKAGAPQQPRRGRRSHAADFFNQ